MDALDARFQGLKLGISHTSSSPGTMRPIKIQGLPHIIGNSGIYRDIIRRKAVEMFEVDRTLYKAMASDQSLPYTVRQQVQRLFETELPKDSSAVRVRNRCGLTGRPRGIVSDFRMSRIMFRQLASAGMLPGIKKASW